MDKFPRDIQDFADTFTTLQETQQLADYDPTFKLTRQNDLKRIDASKVAIKKFKFQASKIEGRLPSRQS